MSLGFNSLRKPRVTNLPGAVGANIIVQRRASPPRKPRIPFAEPPPIKPKETRAVPRVPPQLAAPRKEDSPLDDAHWTYATARAPLCNDEGEQVVDEESRVLLVYPMNADPETGRVRMRLKSAHAVTGQLSYTWVCVYDPDVAKYLVTDFSLLP